MGTGVTNTKIQMYKLYLVFIRRDGIVIVHERISTLGSELGFKVVRYSNTVGEGSGEGTIGTSRALTTFRNYRACNR